MNLVEVRKAEIPQEGWMHDTAMKIVFKDIPEDVVELFTPNTQEDLCE